MTIDQKDSGGRKAPTLIIDVRNALYRAIYAHKAEIARGKNPVHPFVILLRLMSSWINFYKPKTVHMFWDAPRKEVWRKKILESYKDRENNQYIVDISEELRQMTGICQDMFKYMNVRQFEKIKMEADDLIYTAVSIIHPEPTVIISTDSDMIQIPYRYTSCTLYDPKKEIEVTLPDYNPVLFKALKGDKADNIPGYRGVGPKKALKLSYDSCALQEYLQTADRRVYNRNLLLIDLSLCPRILNNTIYIRKKIAETVHFDRVKLLELIKEYKIDGLLAEFNDLVVIFQRLI